MFKYFCVWVQSSNLCQGSLQSPDAGSCEGVAGREAGPVFGSSGSLASCSSLQRREMFRSQAQSHPRNTDISSWELQQSELEANLREV